MNFITHGGCSPRSTGGCRWRDPSNRVLAIITPCCSGLDDGSRRIPLRVVKVDTANAVTRDQIRQHAMVELAQFSEHRTAAPPGSTDRVDATGKQYYVYVIGTAAEELLEMLDVVIRFAVIPRSGNNGFPSLKDYIK